MDAIKAEYTKRRHHTVQGRLIPVPGQNFEAGRVPNTEVEYRAERHQQIKH